MKIRLWLLILPLILVSFLAGYWFHRDHGGEKPAATRKILYYVDPMNPLLKSDKPGIAPCGMALEPVYADQGSTAGGAGPQASQPPGTIRISPEKQQVIGVKVATVEKKPWTHAIRILGRVAPDETRIYRINAAVSGWIQEVSPVTTGSLVKKNELLAKFYSLEYRTLLATYVNLIRSAKSASPGDKAEEPSSRLSVTQLKQLRDTIRGLGQGAENSQADYYRKNLYNYGISDYQLEEMVRTGAYTEDIDIRASIAGFILYRNVSPGLRFDRGADFFRIADLSQVWILADIFENEASYFKPGMQVKMELPYLRKTLYARVSPVLPQFDSSTRTLKVRLVADNPGFVLRPDMFVNVELPVGGASAIIVPADAVLDSGLKKTVFVDKGDGLFEPRQVETGRLLGERVEIVRGLMPGEKIVVSGNFLIDSEARMQQAPAGVAGKAGRDPVCGMNIDEDRSRAQGYERQYRGKTYFFCSPECRDEFLKDPERYLKSASIQGGTAMPGKDVAGSGHASHGRMPASGAMDAKAAPDVHGGMTMPMPRATVAPPGMSDMPAASDPQAGLNFLPGAGIPGMNQAPQLPSMPGTMPMTGPADAPPMPGSKSGGTLLPPTAAPVMDQGPKPPPMPGAMPRTGPTDAPPMPGPQNGTISPPPTVAPTMNRGPQQPSVPGTIPMTRRRGIAPMPDAKGGEMSPPITGVPEPNTRKIDANN